MQFEYYGFCEPIFEYYTIGNSIICFFFVHFNVTDSFYMGDLHIAYLGLYTQARAVKKYQTLNLPT